MRFATRLVLGLVGIIAIVELLVLLFFTRQQSRTLPRKLTLKNLGNKQDILPILTKQESVLSPKVVESTLERKPEYIHVCLVVCGNLVEQSTTSLKSITLFTQKPLKFHIIAESNLHGQIRHILDQWLPVKSQQVQYSVYPLSFPKGAAFWKTLFKPCASQRLFLPSVLSHVDSLIYLDTDTLMLSPIEELWNFFKHFNSSQLAAVAPEGEVSSLNWYSRFALHPFYGKLGINSGVMLMNLTRMRHIRIEQKLQDIYLKYKLKITWGDQDLLNILFHFNPELVFIFGCEWNYRPDHCMYGNNCPTADKLGIYLLHGNRGVFQAGKSFPEFRAIYTTIQGFDHGDDGNIAIESLKTKLDAFAGTYCGKMKDAYLRNPLDYLRKQKLLISNTQN